MSKHVAKHRRDLMASSCGAETLPPAVPAVRYCIKSVTSAITVASRISNRSLTTTIHNKKCEVHNSDGCRLCGSC